MLFVPVSENASVMDYSLKSKIAENLRKHRVLRGFTQEYIADFLGKKDYTAYSRYEQGRSNLKMEDAIKLADLYDVDVQELISISPSVAHNAEIGNKTSGLVSVLVDLDGSSERLDHHILRLKKINDLLARQEI